MCIRDSGSADPFRIWLQIDCLRLRRQTQDDWASVAKRVPPKTHVYGFVCQALARQKNRSAIERAALLREARDCFGLPAEHETESLKHFLARICDLGASVSEEDRSAARNKLAAATSLLKKPGFEGLSLWYSFPESSALNWEAIDSLLDTVPHF